MEQAQRSQVVFASLLILTLCSSVHAQLRVVTWNTAGGPRDGLGDILEAIGNEEVNGIAKPIDILVLQEQSSTSTTTQLIVDELNAIYGDGSYARGFVDGGTSGAGRSGIIYNTWTVWQLEEVAFGEVSTSAQARQTLRYSVVPRGFDVPLYIYSNHYKASTGSTNENRRLVEATAVRSNADALGDGTNIIYSGNFNIRSSTEASYQELLSAGHGQAFDPVNEPGNWHDNASFKRWHTQAPSASSLGGLVGGGVDDRFDFQLVSGELVDGEGYSVIPGSYRVYGNNGTHILNGSISSGSGASAAILETLESVSDHLPVVADYQLPGRAGFSAAFLGETLPERIVLGSNVTLVTSIRNFDPNFTTATAADDLVYLVEGAGDLSGSYSGTLATFESSGRLEFDVDTSELGLLDLDIDETYFSQDSPQIDFITSQVENVVVAPTGDFDGDSDGDGTDYLTWQRGFGEGTWLFEGDADGSRVIDEGDLLLWQSQHGELSSLVVVPEPSSIVIMLSATAVCSRRRFTNIL